MTYPTDAQLPVYCPVCAVRYPAGDARRHYSSRNQRGACQPYQTIWMLDPAAGPTAPPLGRPMTKMPPLVRPGYEGAFVRDVQWFKAQTGYFADERTGTVEECEVYRREVLRQRAGALGLGPQHSG